MSDSMDKIIKKSQPREYKRGPGPTGTDRLHRRVNGLLMDASRLGRKTPDGDVEAWCAELTKRLRDFNDWITAQRLKGGML
jgi:hypothetical protein